MKEDSDRESEPAKGGTNHRLVSNPSLGCGATVKISARSDGRIKSYTPICVACAGPYCINPEEYTLCFITWDYIVWFSILIVVGHVALEIGIKVHKPI